MSSIRILVGTVGIAGLLMGASARASAPTTECQAQDAYLVTRQKPVGDFVGKGYVCENETRYYGWFEPSNNTLTLSELVRQESAVTQDCIHYNAGLLSTNQDSIEKNHPIPAVVHPEGIHTQFRRGWKYIGANFKMDLERKNNQWNMRAHAWTGFISWFTIDCTVNETMYFSCPK